MKFPIENRGNGEKTPVQYIQHIHSKTAKRPTEPSEHDEISCGDTGYVRDAEVLANFRAAMNGFSSTRDLKYLE
jgi:hypothetical protein